MIAIITMMLMWTDNDYNTFFYKIFFVTNGKWYAISNGDNCNNIIVLEVMIKMIVIVTIGCVVTFCHLKEDVDSNWWRS